MAALVVEPTRRIHPWHAGLVLLALGASSTVVGVLEATRSDNTLSCMRRTEQIAKFDYADGEYRFDGPSSNFGVVTITNGTNTGGAGSSSMPVTEIVVKSNQSELVQMPPRTSGMFGDAMNTSVAGRGPSEISYIRFCGGSVDPPTDIAVPLIVFGGALILGGLTITVVGRRLSVR